MRRNTRTGCTVPWTRDNSNICTDKDDVDKAFDISWTRGTNQMKDCKKPCHSLEISLIGDKSEPANHTRLLIFFKGIVTKSEEKRLYTWRNLFAEIGGYVGIFLGYSFFSLGEAIARVSKHMVEKITGRSTKQARASTKLIKENTFTV